MSEGALYEAGRSANAAESSVVVGYRQARGTFVQAIATVLALLAAIGAAIAAAWAALYTRRAAMAAEGALFNLERPHLFMGLGPLPPYEAMQVLKERKVQPRVFYKWRNAGRTPAITQEAKYRILIGPELPSEPAYDAPPVRGEVIIPAGEESPQGNWIFLSGMDSADLLAIEQGEHHLFFFGEVHYADVLGYIHTTGFAVQWLPRERFWTSTGGKAFNFRRSKPDREQKVSKRRT